MSYLLLFQRLPISALLSQKWFFWELERGTSDVCTLISSEGRGCVPVYTDVKVPARLMYPPHVCPPSHPLLTEFLIFTARWAPTEGVWVREETSILLTKQWLDV